MAQSTGLITAERLRAARERSEQRKVTAALAPYEAALKAQAERQKAAGGSPAAGGRMEGAGDTGEKNASYSPVQRAVGTALDVGGQVLEGAGRGVEGIVDGLSTIGTVVRLNALDALTGLDTYGSFRRNFIERDFTGEAAEAVAGGIDKTLGFDPRRASIQDGSWLGQQARAVEQGFGNMLPSVAISVATMGVVNPAVTKGITLAATGVSAGGQAVQEAYRDGAGDLSGFGYGVATGAVEAGTEKLFGGVTSALVGKGWFDEVVPSVASKGLLRIGKNMAEEGLEEGISEMASPALQAIYKGSEALEAYKDPEHYKAVGESTLVGGFTALAYSGSVGYGMAKKGAGHVGKAADVEALLEDLDGLRRKEGNLRKSYKLTEEKQAELDRAAQARYTDIEDVLLRAKDKQRKQIIEEFSLDQAFGADGRMTGDFRRRLGLGGEPDTDLTDKYGQEQMTEHHAKNQLRRSIRLSKDDIEDYLHAGSRTNIGKLKAYEAGEKILLSTDEEIGEYIRSSIGGERHTSVAYGRVNEQMAQDVADYSDNEIRIDGYYLELVASDLQHAYNEHHNPKEKGDLPMSEDDFKQIPGYIDSYDDMIYAKRYKSGDTRICLGKQVNDGNVVIIEVVSKSRGAVQLKTAYKMTEEKYRREYVEGTTKDSPNSGGSRSSKGKNPIVSPRDGTVSGDSIAQKEGNVKPTAQKRTKKKIHPEFYKGDRERVSAALESAGLEAVTDMEALSTEERASYRQLLVVAEKLDALAGGHFDFVLTEASEGETGAYSHRNDVIMISRETLRSPEATAGALYDSWFGVMLEETLHKGAAQGGDAYGVLYGLLLQDKAAVKAVADRLVELGYLGDDPGKARGELDRILNKKRNLTEAELERRLMFYDELIAHLGRDKLATRHFFERLIRKDKSAAERFLEALRGLVSRKRGKGKVEEAVDAKALAMEELFLEAVRECGGTVDDAGRIVGVDEEDNDVIRYDLKDALHSLGEYHADRRRHIESRKGDLIVRDTKTIQAFIEGKLDPDIQRLHIGTVNNRVADLVAAQLDRDIQDYDIVISKDNVTHIFDHHGDPQAEESRGQIAVTFDNISNIIETIIAPDAVDYADDGDTKGIEFRKQIDGENVAITVISTKKSTLTWKSAWIINRSGSRTPSTDAKAPVTTSEMNSRSPADRSIAQSEPNVKPSGENNSRDVRRSKKETTEANAENSEEKPGKTYAERQAEKRDMRQKSEARREAAKGIYDRTEEQLALLIHKEYEGGDYDMGMIDDRLSHEVWRVAREIVNVADQKRYSDKMAERVLHAAVIQTMIAEGKQGDMIAEADTLRQYMRKLNLSGIRGELESAFGQDGVGAVRRRWGAKKDSRGLAPDAIKEELEQRLGFEIPAEHPGDIVVWMENRWQKLKEGIDKKTRKAVNELKGSSEYEEWRGNLSSFLYDQLFEAQKDTEAENLENKYKEAYKRGMKEVKLYLDEQKEIAKYLRYAAEKVGRIKKWNAGEFLAASEIDNTKGKKAIADLRKASVRGSITHTGARTAMKEAWEWYRQDGVQERLGSLWDAGVEEMMRGISEGDGDLTSIEAQNLCHILDNMHKLMEEPFRARIQGKRQKTEEASREYIDRINSQKKVWRHKGLRGIFDELGEAYNDPMAIMRHYDSYIEHGFLSDMLAEARAAETETDYIRHGMMEKVRKFDREHKGYFDKAEGRTIQIGNDKVPAMVALYIHEALGREQALPHLMANGFRYWDGDGMPHDVAGFIKDFSNKTLQSEMVTKAEEVAYAIREQMTPDDMAFIRLTDEIFNKDCKEYKSKTDIEVLGFTNILEGKYIPISIANRAAYVDTETFHAELDRATNASFNKNTQKGAKNALKAEGLLDVLTRHIDGIARYAGMSEFIITYEQLLNINISGNTGNPVNLKNVYDGIWDGHTAYFKQLISDMQRIPVGGKRMPGTKLFEYARGKYAVYSLGLNPKVWATQFSSVFASTAILDPKYVTMGFGEKTGKAGYADLDKYCHLAMLRNADNTAVRAQTVTDKISRVGEFCTKMIGITDRCVIGKLWNACLHQTAAENHIKIDSEENKQKAGELLARVIYETQQNAQATERSAAMRSNNPIEKTLTMFRADYMKMFGRVLDGFGEFRATKGDPVRHKAAKRKLAKATGAMVSSAVYMAIVATVAKKLLAKDEEKDNIATWSWEDLKEGFGEMISAMIGGLPIVGDIVEFFMSGYGFEDMGFSAINDLLSAVQGMSGVIRSFVSGEMTTEEMATKVRLLAYSAGMLTGVPAKNTYNYLRGAVYNIGGDRLVYRIDGIFQEPKYKSDLAAAVEAGDEERVTFLAGLALGDSVSLAKNSAVREELSRLIGAGEDVLPRSVGTEITYDGEEYPMTARQQKRFAEVYEGANEAALRLVQSTYYAKASDAVKAKALKRLYRFYYNMAIEDLLGVEMEQKAQLFAKAIQPEKLAIIIAEAGEIKADIGEDGRAITGSRRKKVAAFVASLRLTAAEKYMVFAYLGYKTPNADAEVRRYVEGLEMSKEGKEELLGYCLKGG